MSLSHNHLHVPAAWAMDEQPDGVVQGMKGVIFACALVVGTVVSSIEGDNLLSAGILVATLVFLFAQPE